MHPTTAGPQMWLFSHSLIPLGEVRFGADKSQLEQESASGMDDANLAIRLSESSRPRTHDDQSFSAAPMTCCIEEWIFHDAVTKDLATEQQLHPLRPGY